MGVPRAKICTIRELGLNIRNRDYGILRYCEVAGEALSIGYAEGQIAGCVVCGHGGVYGNLAGNATRCCRIDVRCIKHLVVQIATIALVYGVVPAIHSTICGRGIERNSLAELVDIVSANNFYLLNL